MRLSHKPASLFPWAHSLDKPSNGRSGCKKDFGSPKSPSNASAARYPLRTAAAIVAGHEVRVQSPARKRFSTDIFCAGRQRSTPGSGENVALISLITVAFRNCASRVVGKTSASSRRHISIISCRDFGTRSYDALITSWRYWPSASASEESPFCPVGRAFVPAVSGVLYSNVLLNTHWVVWSSSVRNGSVITVRSYHR